MVLLPPAHENTSLLKKKQKEREIAFKCRRWGWDYEEIKNPRLWNRHSLDRISEITCSIKESAVAHYLLFMLLLLPVNYLLGRAAGECSGIQ